MKAERKRSRRKGKRRHGCVCAMGIQLRRGTEKGQQTGGEPTHPEAPSMVCPSPKAQEGNEEATLCLGHFHMLYSSNQNN